MKKLVYKEIDLINWSGYVITVYEVADGETSQVKPYLRVDIGKIGGPAEEMFSVFPRVGSDVAKKVTDEIRARSKSSILTRLLNKAAK